VNTPPHLPDKPTLERILGLVTPLVVLVVLIWSLAFLVTQTTKRVMVEFVSVPMSMKSSGLSDVAAQRALVTALQAVISDARETMPGEIKDRVQAEEPQLAIVVPGTTVSLESIIQGTKKMLDMHDVVIRSTIQEVEQGKYIAHVYVTDGSFDVTRRTTPPSDPLNTISEAALAIMQIRTKFIYASALATRARAECYEKDKCNYSGAVKAFNTVLQDSTYERFHRWSWLALSKIDEDLGKR
jgi:hypothetical protein